MPGLPLQGQVAQFVDDQQVGPGKEGDGLLQGAVAGRGDELVGQVCGVDEGPPRGAGLLLPDSPSLREGVS